MVNSNEHKEFLTFILNLYGRSWSNVVCVISDNLNGNRIFSENTASLFESLIQLSSTRCALRRESDYQQDQLVGRKILRITIEFEAACLYADMTEIEEQH